MITLSPVSSSFTTRATIAIGSNQQQTSSMAKIETNPSTIVTLSAEAVQQSKEVSEGIRYGYSADGTYFGTPEEFFSMQKTHYQQLGYEVTDKWMAYFRNEIMHPNPEGGVITAPPRRGY
jgi:guanyl-specific ribonuclease Sa